MHKIYLPTSQPPIKCPNYKLNQKKQDFVRDEVLELTKRGIIEESTSVWNSPLVIVNKQDGGLRLCVDYRRINEVTVKEVCPPPNIDESIEVLAEARLFSTLDLERGYHQIPMDTASKKLTAFTTSLCKFQFRTMPFGLTNAPSTFQSFMYTIFRELIGKGVIVYLDDILIYSKDRSAHLELLKQVLDILSHHNLVINEKKCHFMTGKVNFLRYCVANGKATFDSKFTEKLLLNTPISNRKSLQSTLGLLNYFRKFVRDYSRKVRPLFEALKLDRYPLSSAELKIVSDMKQEFPKFEALALPTATGGFIIECDASDLAIGAVLLQR